MEPIVNSVHAELFSVIMIYVASPEISWTDLCAELKFDGGVPGGGGGAIGSFVSQKSEATHIYQISLSFENI